MRATAPMADFVFENMALLADTQWKAANQTLSHVSDNRLYISVCTGGCLVMTDFVTDYMLPALH